MSLYLILSILGALVLLSSLGRGKRLVVPLAIAGLLGALAVTGMGLGLDHPLLKGMAEFDRYAVLFSCLLLVLGTLVVLLLTNPNERSDIPRVEMAALLLFSLTGGIMMASFAHLVMLFLGVEILSIPLYILAGARKRERAGNEAALKYFITGSFATGFLLFGIALIYGATGSFSTRAIAAWAEANPAVFTPMFHLGLLLMLVGLAFKISAAPFHFWAPDVYEGSPSIVTSFMSTVVKVAAIAAFYRLFAEAFPAAADAWSWVIAAVAALTLAVGNLGALAQRSFKRLMAYSGISHAGFLLLPLLSVGPGSAGALWIYAAAYSFATLIAFVSLLAVEAAGGGESLEALSGLGRRNPFLGVCLTISMLSLIGVPPLAGFFGKLFVFGNAVSQRHVVLVVFAVVMSAVGMAYYMRPIIQTWLRPPAGSPFQLSTSQAWVLGIATAFVVLLAAAPVWVMRFL